MEALVSGQECSDHGSRAETARPQKGYARLEPNALNAARRRHLYAKPALEFNLNDLHRIAWPIAGMISPASHRLPGVWRRNIAVAT